MKFARIATTTATTAALALGLAACGSSEPASTAESAASAPAASGPKFAGQTLTVWRLGAPDEKQNALHDRPERQVQGDHRRRGQGPVGAVAGRAGQVDRRAGRRRGSGRHRVRQRPGGRLGRARTPSTDITEVVKGNPDFQQIPQNLWGYETIDSKIYAAPWGGGTRAVLYRKDWFKELNIEVPKTWDDLVAAAKKIVAEKGKDVDGFAFNGGSDANMSLSPFVWSAGGDFAAFEGGKWVGKLTEPGFKEGFQFYTDLVAKDGVSRKSGPDPELRGHRAPASPTARSACTSPVGWDIATIKEQSSGKVDDAKMGFFSLPAKDGSGPAPAFQGGNDIAIWKDAKNVELAGEYVKLAAGKEFGTRYAKDGGLLPLYPEALAEYASRPGAGAVRRDLQGRQGLPERHRTGPRPMTPRRSCRTRPARSSRARRTSTPRWPTPTRNSKRS